MRQRVRLLAAATATALAVTAVAACSSDDGPEATLQAFLDGWPAGELDAVGFVTPAGSPVASAEVAAAIAELSGQLEEFAPAFTIHEVSESDDVARGRIQVDWPLVAGEDAVTWSYENTVRMTGGEGGWRVIWEPATVHPELEAGDELVVERTGSSRGDILDAAGDPLMTAHQVRHIGVWPTQVGEVDVLVDGLDAAFGAIGLDLRQTLDALPDRIEESLEDDLYVPVVTLREEDYTPISSELESLDGVLVDEGERHLAESRTFARALLGIVDEVTAEIIEDNPGVYEPGDQAGQGGLSQAYDAHLRGVPGQQVLIARTAPNGDVNHTEVFMQPPTDGADLPTTLDREVQTAAERALHTEERRAALVAMRVSDGAVLAVANTEGDAANPVNLAFTGSAPPGSTFKMVAAYGLLAAGEVSLDGQVPCPETLTVDGFSIGNDFSGDRGEIPFRQAVAISCNTAFASLAPRLGEDGLATAGAALGIGGDWSLGMETFTGEVSTGGGGAERAAAAFGQGTTLVSPVAMAAATAAVARGQWLPPSLVVDPEADAPEPSALDSGAAADVQAALREVVTSGTASALQGVPGGAVHGKTGSAEAGDLTHGWFVGWQDDLAVAVFVEDGQSGSGSAVPLVADFLGSLN